MLSLEGKGDFSPRPLFEKFLNHNEDYRDEV